MMKYIILFLKGLLIGIGKIIPGVSGSVLAISLGVYEEAITRINTFKVHIKENISYFLPLVLGIVLSIFLGSHLILYFYEKYFVFTLMLFIGLILGTIPGMVREHPIEKKDFFIIILMFLFLSFLFHGISFPNFVMKQELGSYLYIFFLGMVEVATTLIPGISSTATYMMLGSYEFILNLFANPMQDFFVLFVFSLGFLVCFVFLVKALHVAFQEYSKILWNVIYSFFFYSILFLIERVIDSLCLENLIPTVLIFLVGLQIGSLFSKE